MPGEAGPKEELGSGARLQQLELDSGHRTRVAMRQAKVTMTTRGLGLYQAEQSHLLIGCATVLCLTHPARPKAGVTHWPRPL